MWMFIINICVYTFTILQHVVHTKESTLERADFTFQLLMFVSAEKERVMFIIFFLSIFFVSCCPSSFKLG